MRRRPVLTLVVLAALAVLVSPTLGSADPEDCAPLHVYSLYLGDDGLPIVALDTDRGACNGNYLVRDITGVDPALSAPLILSSRIEVVYDDDLGVPWLDVVLNGLGHVNETVTLPRVGDGVYVSPEVAVVGQGELVLTALLPGGATESVTYVRP